MITRGLYQFQCNPNGHVLANETNIAKLRKLFRDKKIINGKLGPGDPGDFDFGAWHVLCHLAAATALFRNRNGFLAWVEISHVPALDYYIPTVTVETKNEPCSTFSLHSEEGCELIKGAILLGYIEGSSLGHISARDVMDPPDRFNKWQRQKFDKPIMSRADGGRVWEHWCTVRDIRERDHISTSVLSSYLHMVSLCGGTLTATVARGRSKYNHPTQLLALIKSGFIAKEDALLEMQPKRIPKKIEFDFYSADPKKCLLAAKTLDWSQQGIFYYMYGRRIHGWRDVELVRKDFSKNKI